MRISLTVEMHRPARRSLVLLAGVLLLAVPAVVLASHQLQVGLARRENVTSASTFPFDPASTVSAMIFPFGEVSNPNNP